MNQNILLNTYDGKVEVSSKWLKNYLTDIGEQASIENFMDNYTWDDGEYIQILLSVERKEKQIEQLTKQLYQGISLFKKGNQEGILHDGTKGCIYQFSYFDKRGPIGDIQKNTLEEMAISIYNYGFQPCDKEDLQIIK